MPIEFRCENVAEYDEVTQAYNACKQKIRVPDSRAGTFIKCPKCENRIQVPEFTAANPKKSPQGKTKQNRKQGVGADLDKLSTGNRDLMSMDFQSEPTTGAMPAFSDKRNRCPKCGGLFNDDRICQTCDFVDPVQEAKRRKSAKAPLKTAGFQLWLNQIASDGVSVATIGYVVSAILFLFLGLIAVAGILSTTVIGALFTAAAAFGLLFLVSVFLKTKQLAKEGNTNLGILAPIWNMVLLLARSQKWQNYDSKLKGRKIIDLRNAPISDIDLEMLDGLQECQVLDLEDSKITDEGLKQLYGLPYLQCLVLKNNDVTDEAVTMLQQQNRRLWIWI